MRAAVLSEHGATPACGEFDEPAAGPGQVVVEVAAAGLHHLDLHKATGQFYMGPPPLPSVVGTDGVGRLPDGRRVYFDTTVMPYGSMGQRTLVPEDAVLEVADGVEDAVAAALGNTGLAAWLALTWRARLQAGETVLVLGATGALGSVAVQAAQVLGAKRVVAADLAGERLDRLAGETVATVAVDDAPDLAERLRAAAQGGVDVTIDTLWGQPALAAMQAANRFARHVEIGTMAATEITLPGALIRSASLDLLGFNVSYPALDIRREGYRRLTEHAARGDIRVDVRPVPLDDIHSAWERQREAAGGPKQVIVPAAKEQRP
jgi:NADPH:quinone reductase-like Zn-dependent oxidoreductase